VSGFRIFSAERHSVHARDSPIHSRRSALFNGNRFFAERCRTPIWWRSAMFSSCRAARLFRTDDTKASASERHSKIRGSTLRNVCNPHHLNCFVIYERHTPPPGRSARPCRAPSRVNASAFLSRSFIAPENSSLESFTFLGQVSQTPLGDAGGLESCRACSPISRQNLTDASRREGSREIVGVSPQCSATGINTFDD
jgi:hypothetical protein